MEFKFVLFSIKKTLHMEENPADGGVGNSAIPRVFLIRNTLGITKFSYLGFSQWRKIGHLKGFPSWEIPSNGGVARSSGVARGDPHACPEESVGSEIEPSFAFASSSRC